jgi:hypothetical protein
VTRLKVIYDTDPGVDDAMALLLLARHPDVDLIGITTCFGNATIETTTRNALYLKQLFGIAAPVSRGAGEPIVGGAASEPPTFRPWRQWAREHPDPGGDGDGRPAAGGAADHRPGPRQPRRR